MYGCWAVLLAARVLERAAERLETTSGGSGRFWLLILLAVPLLWMGWGKAAPFFRTVEILWLAMAVTVGLVLVFGVSRAEWCYVSTGQDDWLGGLLAAAEIFAPALFVLPYIYRTEDSSAGRGVAWLSALGTIAALLSLVTMGVLGGAAEGVSRPFFVAAGALGRSARCEGLLSVVWLLSDLTLAGLLCRVLGGRRWPALGVVAAVIAALFGLVDRIPREIYVAGPVLLLLLSLFLPCGKGKIVVDFQA
jgi:hypothetical protein